MSKQFSTIKNYFDKKLWNIEKVRLAVSRGVITPEEFKEITGEEYK